MYTLNTYIFIKQIEKKIIFNVWQNKNRREKIEKFELSTLNNYMTFT